MIEGKDLKLFREILCSIDPHSLTSGEAELILKTIGRIDGLRPLGPDGKHGERHTMYCGCDGVQIEWRPVVGTHAEMNRLGQTRHIQTKMPFHQLPSEHVEHMLDVVFPEDKTPVCVHGKQQGHYCRCIPYTMHVV